MNPESQKAFTDLLVRASGKDVPAMQFLVSFSQYFNDIVAFAENGCADPNGFIALLARTCTVYSLPFYARNAHFLMLPVQGAIGTFSDGLKWRDHPEEWKAQWSEHSRLALADVILAVATLQDVKDPTLVPELRELLHSEFA